MLSRHHTMRCVRILVTVLAWVAMTWPGIAPVHASSTRADVSLARGWEHRTTVAPGLVITGALGGLPIVAGGPGLVAYEQQGGGFRMYASATGQDWTQLPSPAFRPGDYADRLFIVGQRFIIPGFSVSTTGPVPRIWASANGGQAWQESPAHLQIEAVVSGADGVIAFVRARSSTQLWTSADGVTWRQLPDRNGAFESGNVTSAAEGGPGYVACGIISEIGDPGHGHATVWTSPDGLSWTEVPDAGTIFAGALNFSQMVAGPAGVAAVGEVRGGQRNGIWASRDGIHWRQAADGFLTPPPLAALPLAVWQGGFAEIQDRGTGAELYSSPDGLTWTRVGSDGVFGGSAWVTAMTSFHGGLAAIGGFGSHPKPSCLPDASVSAGGLRQASVLLWSPEASQTAPAPTLDRTDPRALRLLPQDLPSGFLEGRFLDRYVNLCAYLPALGRHRAYRLKFDTGARGLALDIVTQRAAAAKAAFHQVERLVTHVPWVPAFYPAVTVLRLHELRATMRIGNETRVFTIKVADQECGDLVSTAGFRSHQSCTTYHYRAYVVVWRHGAVIGLVVTDQGRGLAIALARQMLARSEHPSD